MKDLEVSYNMKQLKDYDGKFVGPARVYLSHEHIPGLVMSRSLGVLAVKAVGVIPDPGN